MNPETVNQTGESAFPQWTSCGDRAISEGGLSVRDYFAAKAMQSYLMDQNRDDFEYIQWANAAYEMADAMLKARAS